MGLVYQSQRIGLSARYTGRLVANSAYNHLLGSMKWHLNRLMKLCCATASTPVLLLFFRAKGLVFFEIV